MKGTYDLMLYVVNEFLIDYAKFSHVFKDDTVLADGDEMVTVVELLRPVYAELSAHEITGLTAVEYYDATEYYNISADTDARSDVKGTNDRFWINPAGEDLMSHNGIDSDFKIDAIKKFYFDTLGIRDNFISSDAALGRFLDAVFSLGATDSYVHEADRDMDAAQVQPYEMFGARMLSGKYTDEMFDKYVELKNAWATYLFYLSDESYEYQISDSVSAQILGSCDFISAKILENNMQGVSSVYDKYIGKVQDMSAAVASGVKQYDDMISSEYSYYFAEATDYKYCYENEQYKHAYYINSNYDAGLEYWYDKIQRISEYVSENDGQNITNWPIRDTVEHFCGEFARISSIYMSIINGSGGSEVDIPYRKNWGHEFGFVDIGAMTLEKEMQYGYDFMNARIQDRKQYLQDVISNLKQQAIQL